MNMIADITKIPCVYMRGGTSKGPFFKASDLPSDESERNAVLLAIMGSPHPLQINGIGGSQPQTSKVAIVSQSSRDDADVDYLFAQVMVNDARVDTNPNCGNMLVAVAPFSIEEGLCEAESNTTTVRIHNVNTGAIVHSVVQTPNGKVAYRGEQTLDGVNDSGAPVFLHFLNAEGSKTGRFFPTGQVQDTINGICVSLVDYSVPMMLVNAHDLGLNGDETSEDIDGNTELLNTLEGMRLEAGERMGLGDVSGKVVPKVSLISPPQQGGALKSHYLTPHTCHKSHAITGALCLASSCYVQGTISAQCMAKVYDKSGNVRIEHPSGKMDLSVMLSDDSSQKNKIDSIAVVRTARRLFEGCVITP